MMHASKNNKYIKYYFVVPLIIVGGIIFLLWLVSNFAGYLPNSFRFEFGFEAPEHRVFLSEQLWSLCSILPPDSCALEYRFDRIDQVELDKITSNMKNAGFDNWQVSEDRGSPFIGNYGSGPDISIKGRLYTKKVINRSQFSLFYYPVNQTMDAVYWRN